MQTHSRMGECGSDRFTFSALMGTPCFGIVDNLGRGVEMPVHRPKANALQQSPRGNVDVLTPTVGTIGNSPGDKLRHHPV
jgi:hypothetical protein